MSIQDTIVDRLCRQGRGKVFTPKDFLDIGSREAVDQALSPKHRSQLLQDARYTTDWIADAARKIAGDEAEAANHG